MHILLLNRVSDYKDHPDDLSTGSSLAFFLVYGGSLHSRMDPSRVSNRSMGLTLKGFDAIFPVGDVNADGKDDIGFFRAR